FSFFSTRAAQEAQVIPPTARSMRCWSSAAVPVDTSTISIPSFLLLRAGASRADPRSHHIPHGGISARLLYTPAGYGGNGWVRAQPGARATLSRRPPAGR